MTNKPGRTSKSTNKLRDELNLRSTQSGEKFVCIIPNLLAELSFVTLTIHFFNGLNDKNLVKPRKSCFLTVQLFYV